MKKITMVVGAGLLGASILAQAGTLVPNRNVDISFDTFCDGLHLVINQDKGIVKGEYVLGPSCTTSPNTTIPLGAGVPAVISGGKYDGQGVVVGFDPGGLGFMVIVSDSPQTFKFILTSTGDSIQGTWSAGAPKAVESTRALID